MPPLDCAIPLSEVDYMSEFIRQDLNLDMPRPLDIFLDINIGIPKCQFCFLLCGHKCADKSNVIMTNPHPFSSPACRGLDNNRVLQSFGNLYRLFLCLYNRIAARYDGDADFLHGLPRSHLIA